MAGLNFFKRPGKIGSLLTIFIPLLVLTGCFGEGDGPTVIPGTPITPEEPSNGGSEQFDSGLVANGDFEAGVSPWFGNATNVVDDGGNNVNFADIALAGQPFDVNLSQVLTITEGETYVLTFKARSDRARTMIAGIGLNEEPFTDDTETVNLTAEWQTFQFVLTATGFGNANSRVLFDMGADTGQVVIDDVSLFVANGGGGAGTSIDPDAALYRTGGDPDLVIPDDYAEVTPFGSGSVIDPFFADDETFSPSLSVFSGTGYGANVAQVGFIGFPAGFLGDYESVSFKVKGMPNFVIFVKLFDGVDTLRINLTSSGFSEFLSDGWYQVSIPVSRFASPGDATGIVLESDNTAAGQFRMLLTDVGFSGTGDRVPSDPGTFPDVTLYDRDGDPDLVFGVDYADITPFGSGASFDGNFTGDIDFRPAFSVTTGFGYDKWNAQLAYVGFAAGFATAYETLDFKVKGLSGDVIRVKLLPDPAYVAINVTSSGYATALGNGWFEVVVPIADIPGAATADGLLFETIEPAPAASFTYLLTDVGFSGTGTGGGGGGGGGGGELLTNGDFEASASDKAPWINAGDVATNNFYTADAVDGQQVFETNLSQVLDITQDAEYVLSFRARSSVARNIIAGFGDSGPPFAAVIETVPLTTEWQTFSYTLTATGFGGADSRVLFDMGGTTSTVDIDNVSLTLSAGSGELLTNGDFEASASDKAPWINAGGIATNNFYTADAVDGQQVFETNLSQVLDITENSEYVLSFRAKASVARNIIAGFGDSGPPFNAVIQTVPLTTEWQSFSYNLTATGFGGADSRVLFDMGGTTSTVNIDDVSLTLAGGGG